MWAVLRWLKLRRYHARLSFTSEDVVLNSLQEDLPQEGTNGWNHIDGNKIKVCVYSIFY